MVRCGHLKRKSCMSELTTVLAVLANIATILGFVIMVFRMI